MNKFVDLGKKTLITNSPLWQINESEGEQILQIIDNKEVDHIGGKVALINDIKRNYTMQAEMRFLGHHLGQERAGWFGFVMRAQDVQNYEFVWFMPKAESRQRVAYFAVAHGIVPWWTELFHPAPVGRLPGLWLVIC
ncbi:MAG: hypothetical protein AB1410_08215 [Acidobacteriota bacterium]